MDILEKQRKEYEQNLIERKDKAMKDLETVEAELQQITIEKKLAKDKIIIENIDALLALVPYHGRTSCSDTNIANSDRARCGRCVLLNIRAEQYVPENVSVEVCAFYRD